MFDGLYLFFRDHPSQHDPDLMAWRQMGDCASSSDPNSASDGDLNIAFGLLLAHAQWGSGGKINYRAEALKVMAAIRSTCDPPTTDLVQMGDWVDPAYPLEYEAVRISDLMPLQLRTFRTAPATRAGPTRCSPASTCYSRMQQNWAPGTGLVPDFAVNTPTHAAPGRSRLRRRVPCRQVRLQCLPRALAAGARLPVSPAGANALAITMRMMDWLQTASGGDIYRIYGGYKLNGTATVGGTMSASPAPSASAPWSTHATRRCSTGIWDDVAISTAGDPTDYYGATLRMVYLLAMSGNLWAP